jgi:hypothetical protein
VRDERGKDMKLTLLDNKLSLTDIEKEGGKFIGGDVESRGSEISQSKQSRG